MVSIIAGWPDEEGVVGVLAGASLCSSANALDPISTPATTVAIPILRRNVIVSPRCVPVDSSRQARDIVQAWVPVTRSVTVKKRPVFTRSFHEAGG
jgi:hypothetical protein